MNQPEPLTINIQSTSTAGDLGLRALADLASAAAGIEYRVIGGHMVQLHLHLHPVAVEPRVTSDADAGLEANVEIIAELLDQLVEHGYIAESGNRYVRKDGDGERQVDILLPQNVPNVNTETALGRSFDLAPGLLLAVSCPAIQVRVQARLSSSERISYEVPVPPLEIAVVLKALAWDKRKEPKDLQDIATLMEIAYAHPQARGEWKLGEPGCKGARRDAARSLHSVGNLLDSGPTVLTSAVKAPARTNALIRELIARPDLS